MNGMAENFKWTDRNKKKKSRYKMYLYDEAFEIMMLDQVMMMTTPVISMA